MKPLDFGFYRSLKRPAAQRAYRFLDKRFHHKPEWEFDLHTFACEKLGFSRNYDTGQLKARLSPAMTELEKAGYIKPVSYKKVKPRTWSVLVSKPATENSKLETSEIPGVTSIAETLLARGVSKATSESLASEFSKERIEEKLRYLDWLIKRNDKRTPANVAGFLVAAIRNDYPLPKDYQKELHKKARVAVVPKSTRPANFPMDGSSPSRDASRPVDLSVILSGLTPAEIETLEQSAVAAARPVERDSYLRQKVGGGSLFLELKAELITRFLRSTGRLAA